VGKQWWAIRIAPWVGGDFARSRHSVKHRVNRLLEWISHTNITSEGSGPLCKVATRNARSGRKGEERSPRTNQPAMAGAGGSEPEPDWRGGRGGRGSEAGCRGAAGAGGGAESD
jgi:hypothetical protein